MKKILSIILVLLMLFAFISCGSTETNTTTISTTISTISNISTTTNDNVSTTTSEVLKPTTTTSEIISTTTIPQGGEISVSHFDEKNIVLQFGSVSDIHTSTDANKVKNAFKILKDTALSYSSDGLSAIFVCGDLTNDYGSNQTTKANEIKQVKSTYESVINPAEIPLIYTLGNHDHDFMRNGGAGSSLEKFISVFGRENDYLKYDVECPDSNHGSRHVVIGDYHFLMVEPIRYDCGTNDPSGCSYFDETKAWLDNELQKITLENPNQYVFVYTHPMIYDTVYGSDLVLNTLYWYTKDLTSILSKYNQVVTFGGHLHFPINDERTIMQDTFTSVGSGSVQYMAVENGGYINMSSATVMNDSYSISSGFLVQIDKDGNVRLIRMNFSKNESIKDPFILNAPNEDGSHLTKYTKNRGSESINEKPSFGSSKIVLSTNENDGKEKISAIVKFGSAKDDDLIHHYEILVEKVNGNSKTKISLIKTLSDFYQYSNVEEMKDSHTINLGNVFERGYSYLVTVTAYDSWGLYDSISHSFETKMNTEGVSIPNAYMDIDLSGSEIKDSMGNVSFTNHGTEIKEIKVIYNGVEKTLPAINILAKDQYAIAKFNLSKDEMDTLISSGFSIEAVYVNRTNTGLKGIFSGYGDYGIGLYEQTGKPTYRAYINNAFVINQHSEKTSEVELTHVIASYSAINKQLILYVNGSGKIATASGTYVAKVGNPDEFCIGANSGDSSISALSENLSIVSLRVYNSSITKEQAKLLFSAFEELFK